MSEVVRLTLVSHAMTDAMAAGRFADDEPLNALGYNQIDAVADIGQFDSAFTAPEVRARQTAELLGLRAAVEDRLADLDVGRWHGCLLSDPPPAELAAWLSRPDSAPHGGESVEALIARVGAWMDDVSGTPVRLAAVTHPAVVRAAIVVALDAPPESFWRIDIAPVSRTVLHHRGRWTLRWGAR
ncbi:histidine phosphatase family protein [Mycobacterium sp. DL592]|uniref:histidine phosphatase family protein n=1 Tax=Mycobacterium sp. DL592 TaxID=2675524 RepID=UPI00141DE28E|nr:histidine phosphatase family protein [Mycobacterium sp. DL592]